MITVELDIKRGRDSLGRFIERKPGMFICKELASEVERNLISSCPYWSGTLMSSINKYYTGDGYAISMSPYAGVLERGGKPHWPAYGNIKFRQWAESKGWNWNILRFVISKKGTQPQEFIQPSINMALMKFNRIAFDVINRTARESGFKKL